MAWGAIYGTGKSDLVIMERDQDAPRKGYTAKSYQKALAKGLLPIYNGTRQFQQDNARIHNFGGTPQWLQQHCIQWIEWPAHSPDLNPIEHCWKALKQNLTTLFPHIEDLKNNIADRAKLEECMHAAWAAVPQALITRLIESLPRRLRAVIRARSWYTKY